MNKPAHPLGPWDARAVEEYRFDARMAYLDGRTARAKVLYRKADNLARRLHRLMVSHPESASR